MSNVVVIPIAELEVSKPAEFDKGKVEQLASSIKTDGLIHRPVVVPLPEGGQFKYRVIAGRKRVYAAGRILGNLDIECDVWEGLDDDSVLSIECAENLFRTALSDEARTKELIRWHAIYTKRNPHSDGDKGGYKKAVAAAEAKAAEESPAAKAPKAKKKKGDVVLGGGDGLMEVAAEKPAVVVPKTFAKVLEEALGISSSSAGRLARVARNLSEEQITVLYGAKTTNEQVDSMAALGKGDAIEHAIKLIASGMSIDLAVGAAKKLKAEKPAKEGETPKAAAQPKVKELSDEEWLTTYCGVIYNALKHKVAFKNDALLYRRINENLARFRTGIKKHVDEAKSPAGHNGAFFSNLYRVIRASHPSHWLVCASCMGDGKNHEGDQKGVCQKCFGSGYKMKLED